MLVVNTKMGGIFRGALTELHPKLYSVKSNICLPQFTLGDYNPTLSKGGFFWRLDLLQNIRGMLIMIINLDYPSILHPVIGLKQHAMYGWARSSSPVIKALLAIDGGAPVVGAINVDRPDLDRVPTSEGLAKPSGFEFPSVLDGLGHGSHSFTITVICASGESATLTAQFTIDPEQVSSAITPNYETQYQLWLRNKQKPRGSFTKRRGRAERFFRQPRGRPLFSIVMPTYNSDPHFLASAIESVLAQTFNSWELLIIDDGSTSANVKDLLKSSITQDSRVSVQFLPSNQGIARATQIGIDRAAGDFVGFLDHDDLLWPDALRSIATAVTSKSEVDIVYTDEDKIDVNGKHFHPFFKPDWSPHLHLTCNYTCHFTVYRRSLVVLVGGMSPTLSGSQDYDLMLRASERARQIIHVPEILYSWRATPGSTALSANAKPYAHTAAQAALSGALVRRGIAGDVTQGMAEGRWRVRRALPVSPSVTIIVPTITERHITRCMHSLLALTEYSNYRVCIVENSGRANVLEACDTISGSDPRVSVMRVSPGPFNYSALNNRAVSSLNGDYVCFLNDDTEIIDGEWLNAMMEIAVSPQVGIVGAQLLYPDKTVQHAGVVLGVGGVAGHAFKHFPPDNEGANGLRFMIRDVSAVTFACALVKRQAFTRVGGFDALNVPVGFSDVDFCLRVKDAGYEVIYTPHSTLIHHESASRGSKGHLIGESYMRERWGKVLSRDTFYNSNLTLDSEDYSIAIKEHGLGFWMVARLEAERLVSRARDTLVTQGPLEVARKMSKVAARYGRNAISGLNV